MVDAWPRAKLRAAEEPSRKSVSDTLLDFLDSSVCCHAGPDMVVRVVQPDVSGSAGVQARVELHDQQRSSSSSGAAPTTLTPVGQSVADGRVFFEVSCRTRVCIVSRSCV